MTVDRVRLKIRQALKNYMKIVFSSTFLTSLIISTSFLSSDLISAYDSSSLKKLKVLSKSKRLKLIVTAVKKTHLFARQLKLIKSVE